MSGDIKPGTYIGRYKVDKRIGAGAMGEVYLAEDESLARKVALKILSDAHRNNPELKARFLREARAVAKISHPNVVAVFSIDDFEGRPCFAMEYLSGKDLGVLVKERGPLPQAEAVAAVQGAAHGLEEASTQGLIHRDVKPTNLIITDKGMVKVTDFGLAKPLDSADPGLTQAGVVVGTPDYIAPEQARGDELDARVDIYALGCTLFYLLTGRPPYRQDDDAEDRYLRVVARHIRAAIPDVRKAAKQPVDDDVADLCRRMMAKRPEERPSYAELVRELDDISLRLHGEPPHVRERTDPSQLARRAASGSTPSKLERDPAPSDTGSDDDDDLYPGGRRPGFPWARLATVATFLFFAVSLALYLTAPKAKSVTGGTGPATSDGGLAIGPGPLTPDLTPPEGFLLVKKPDGVPAFFVARLPVSKKDFGQPSKKHDGLDPAVELSYEEARAYARQKGGRMMTTAEWDLAVVTEGFAPAGVNIWEWVDDGIRDTKVRQIRRAPSGAATRESFKDYKDVTFRVVRDLPGQGRRRRDGGVPTTP